MGSSDISKEGGCVLLRFGLDAQTSLCQTRFKNVYLNRMALIAQGNSESSEKEIN